MIRSHEPNDFDRSKQKSLGHPDRPIRAAVIGAGGGIGTALVSALAGRSSVSHVHSLSRHGTSNHSSKIVSGTIDIENEASIAAAALLVKQHSNCIDLVIIATGLLHDGNAFQPEKSWKSFDGAAMARAFRVNTIGPALVAKHFIPLLSRQGKSVLAALSARVGSIEDNRIGGWYGYRASKAGLNMTIRGLAIELSRTHPNAVCVALHPGTVDTTLSKPFQHSVRPEQLKPAEVCALELLDVVDSLSTHDTGNFIAYDGTTIPF